MSQKAILTFQDTGNDQVKINLEFDPPVKGDAHMTPSISMAMQALEVLKRRHSELDDEDEDE